MKPELTMALVTAASGTVLFAVKPELATGMSAGTGFVKLGVELQRTFFGREGDSPAALARVRRRVSADLETWAAAEGRRSEAEIAVADGLLEQHLPGILLDRTRIAEAAKSPEGFVDAGVALLMGALADRAPFFDPRASPIGFAYAETVLRITLSGVLTERAYFEAFEPHLLLGLVQSTAAIEDAVKATDQKVEAALARLAEIKAAPNVSERELRGILRAFDVAGVDTGDAVDAILAKAQEYQTLKDRLARHADSRTQGALIDVREALDKGDLSNAMDRLRVLINDDEDREERSIRVTLEIIEYYATLSSFMLRHDNAAQAYFQASAVAATVNAEKSYAYSMLQADELIEHALRFPDVAAYEAVVSLFGSILPRFKPDTEASVTTIANMISAMGQMAERIEPSRAVTVLDTVLKMEDALKSERDEEWFPPLPSIAELLTASWRVRMRLTMNGSRSVFANASTFASASSAARCRFPTSPMSTPCSGGAAGTTP